MLPNGPSDTMRRGSQLSGLTTMLSQDSDMEEMLQDKGDVVVYVEEKVERAVGQRGCWNLKFENPVLESQFHQSVYRRTRNWASKYQLLYFVFRLIAWAGNAYVVPRRCGDIYVLMCVSWLTWCRFGTAGTTASRHTAHGGSYRCFRFSLPRLLAC